MNKQKYANTSIADTATVNAQTNNTEQRQRNDTRDQYVKREYLIHCKQVRYDDQYRIIHINVQLATDRNTQL
jgi:hypothetical protein